MRAEVSGNNIRFGIDENALRQKIMSSAVYSINGVRAASDGSFYIHGSECDSWGYVSDGKALGTGAEEPETVAEEGASGIWLADLCPACQTCDIIYAIKQEIEYLDVLVNMLKDVELHDNTSLEEHEAALKALVINGGESCPTDWRTYKMFPPWKGLQLLQQYITVAHMWNYAVVQNNASFKLEIAPEDTAGFVVMTKRSLPNCDDKWHIKCTIDISYVGTINDDGSYSGRQQNLSVYVPEPTLRFKPFTHYDQEPDKGLPEPVAGLADPLYAQDAALDGSLVHVYADADCTTKQVVTDEIAARVGGTYEVSVKILPFRNYVIYDKNGNIITLRGSTVNLNGTTVGGNVVYDNYAPDPAKTVKRQIPNPTKKDYLDAKTAPTGSVPFNNVWQVHILWEVGKEESTPPEGNLGYTPVVVPGQTESTVEVDAENTTPARALSMMFYGESGFVPAQYYRYEETRQYTCTGVREPNTQALITGSTVPVDIEEDPPPNNTVGEQE